MSDQDRNWKFVDECVTETPAAEHGRSAALELGIDPVSPAVAGELSVLAAASLASAIIEIGTGTGVSGLALLAGSPDSHLTTIDIEPEHQAIARTIFAEANIPSARVRFITGQASDLLTRMNEGAYDLVLVDADPESVLEYVEHGLRLTKPSGIVLVAHALSGVANPADRSAAASELRALITELSASAAVVTAISPAGQGILQIVKRP